MLPKALDAVAKSGDEAIFKKLVGADGTATDAASLRDLASKCGPEARAKLNALAKQAKAQGGIEGLGIDPPEGPGAGAKTGASTKLGKP